MRSHHLNAAALVWAVLVWTAPAHADVQFRTKPMPEAKIPRGKAQCDIRLLVDQEVEVSLHEDSVSVHTLTGADARDNGSTCSAPLPGRDVDGFTMSVKKRHGDVTLVAEPSARNQHTAMFAIHDKAEGEGAYEVRLTWNPPAAPVGINANNAFHYAARGVGNALLNDGLPVPLSKVTVDVDRGGKAVVTFPLERAGFAVFTGRVMSWDSGVLKMDAVAGERFHGLPGPLYVYFDASKQVYKITLEATNGQEQLRANWERK